MAMFDEVCDKGNDTWGKDMEMRLDSQSSQIYNLEVVLVGLKCEQVVWHKGLEDRTCSQLAVFGYCDSQSEELKWLCRTLMFRITGFPSYSKVEHSYEMKPFVSQNSIKQWSN